MYLVLLTQYYIKRREKKMIDMNKRKELEQVERFVPGERHGKSLPPLTIAVRAWVCFAVLTLIFMTYAFFKYTDWDHMHYMITGEGRPYDIPEYINIEPKINVRFNDGCPTSLNFKLRFKIEPEDADKISKVTRTLNEYENRVLIPSIRSASRAVADQYSTEEVFTTKRLEFQLVLSKLIKEEVYLDTFATLQSLDIDIKIDPDIAKKIYDKYGVISVE